MNKTRILLMIFLLFLAMAAVFAEDYRFFDVSALFEMRDGPVVSAFDAISGLVTDQSDSYGAMQELAVNTAYDYMQDEMLFGGQIELGPMRNLSMIAGGFWSGKKVTGTSESVAFEFNHRFDAFSDIRVYARQDHIGLFAGVGAMWTEMDMYVEYVNGDGEKRSSVVELTGGGGYGILGFRLPVWRFVRLGASVSYYPQSRMTTFRVTLGPGWNGKK